MHSSSLIPRLNLPRFWLVAASVALAQGACTIEQTPQEYIDHLTTPGAALEASRDELTVRLLSTAPALERRDRSSLLGALAPETAVYVVGARPGEELTTPRAVVDTLVSIVGQSEVEIGEAVVSIAAGNDVAWFRVQYDMSGGDAEDSVLFFTGVFVRAEGDWRLAQGHLSTSLSQPPSNPEPDGTQPADG
jgi:hypothetical protein